MMYYYIAVYDFIIYVLGILYLYNIYIYVILPAISHTKQRARAPKTTKFCTSTFLYKAWISCSDIDAKVTGVFQHK